MDDSNPTVEIVSTTRQGAAKRWLPSAGMRTRTKRRTRALAVLVSLPVWLCCGNAQAASTGTPGLSVIPRPSTRLGLSYFKIRAQPGTSVQAGAVELQNPTAKRLTVALSPVDGQTLDTLGSGYAPPGSPGHASALWLTLAAHHVSLPPMTGTRVAVSVRVPPTAGPGDYLSGISIEALHQQPQGLAKKGVSIASVERYAIGVEVLVPGPRHPAIEFTGASIQRQPAGLTFTLGARNSGNVILQGVRGHVLITRAGHTVVSRAIEAGTFVTGTSIAYPVPATDQSASAGTRYRILALLRYDHRVARLDTLVTFGPHEAVIQSHYARAPATTGKATPWWQIVAFTAALLYGLLTTILLLRRRLRSRQAVLR
jgi:hypothetical protein